MGTTSKPAEDVHFCDVCGREGGFLQTCDLCGGEYCVVCVAHVAGSWFHPHVCRTCSKREDVEKIVVKHTEQLTPIFQKRRAAIKRLGARLRKAGKIAPGGKAADGPSDPAKED